MLLGHSAGSHYHIRFRSDLYLLFVDLQRGVMEKVEQGHGSSVGRREGGFDIHDKKPCLNLEHSQKREAAIFNPVTTHLLELASLPLTDGLSSLSLICNHGAALDSAYCTETGLSEGQGPCKRIPHP